MVGQNIPALEAFEVDALGVPHSHVMSSKVYIRRAGGSITTVYFVMHCITGTNGYVHFLKVWMNWNKLN